MQNFLANSKRYMSRKIEPSIVKRCIVWTPQKYWGGCDVASVFACTYYGKVRFKARDKGKPITYKELNSCR